MCGLVGFIDKKKMLTSSAKVGDAMLTEISHRGPDSQGKYVDVDEGIYLAHARLKVLDLSENASQPMCYDNLILLYNGEIYNFNAIKSLLMKDGYIFSSNTDTEVLLKGWHKWGLRVLEQIRGIFAFVVYDTKSKLIYLVRDNLGVKPLYFLNTPEYFSVSSEAKAFCKLSGFQIALAKENLPEYLTYRFIQAPETLFKNIFVLPPASYAIYDMRRDMLSVSEYWDFARDDTFDGFSLADTQTYFDCLFREIIDEQLVSDVPLGLLLSGGIDSSMVSKFTRESWPSSNRDLVAYTVDFNEEKFSEWKYSSQIVNRFNLKAKRCIFCNRQYVQALKETNYQIDEPVSQPHTPYFYLLSKNIKEHLTVVFSGEGADELFAGYSRYSFFSEKKSYEEVEKFVLNSTRFLSNAFIGNLLGISEQEVEYLSGLKRRKLLQRYRGLFEGLKLAQILDLKTYLVSLLNRIDKTTMAFGVETRVPFLDPRMVLFGCNLPAEVKVKKGLRAGITKFWLKREVASLFGEEFAYRRKVGFHTPFKRWLRESKAFGSLRDVLVKDHNTDYLFDNTKIIYEWIDRFLHGDTSYQASDTAWIFLNLKLWHRSFIECRDFPRG